MSLEYYTYTNGAIAHRVLNAVATFFDTPTFGSLVEIAAMLGAVATAAHFALTRNPTHLYKWAAVYFAVPLCLINMKTEMQVIDKTEPTGIYSVANVPYLVALPTFFTSSMMHGLTEGVEMIFSSLDDERYGRTGMMFGSRLYKLSRQSTIKDIELKGNWSDFFANCIFGDIQINGKYSWDDIYQANDIWKFLDSQSMSPIRGVFFGKNNYYTCKDAYPVIKKRIEDEVVLDFNLLGSYLYGNKAGTQKAFLESSLSNSYQTYQNISRTASQIMLQNMTMNAIRNSVDEMDGTAAAMNYAYTQNKMQTSSMWANIGLQAKEFVPMLHTIMFLLFSCTAIFVAAAAMIPGLTYMVLTNYIKTFCNLALWPSLFALLNAIMMWGLESRSVGIADDFGGLTLSNDNALDEMHTRFALIAGYLMMSIPLLAGAILKGGAAAMSSLNYQLAGMINSTNARTSAAAASGDVNLGNMQVDTRSYNMTTANKHDTAGMEKHFGNTVQRPDGTYVTEFANGKTVYNVTDAMSKLPMDATAGKQAESAVRNEYNEALAVQKRYETQLGEHIQTGVNFQSQWQGINAQNKSYGDGNTVGTTAQVTRGMDLMETATQNLVKETGWSHDNARAYLQAASAGFDIGGSLGGKGSLSPISIGASAGIKWTDEERETFSKLDRESRQDMLASVKQYREGANTVVSAAQQVDNKETHTDVEQFANSFANNWGKTQQLHSNVAAAEHDTKTLQHALTNVTTDSQRLTENLSQPFAEFVQKRNGRDADEILTSTEGWARAQRAELWERYLESDQFIADITLPTRTDIALKGPQDLDQKEFQTMMGQQFGAESIKLYSEIVDETKEKTGSDDFFNMDTFNDVTRKTQEQHEQTLEKVTGVDKDSLNLGGKVKEQVEQEIPPPRYEHSMQIPEDYKANNYPVSATDPKRFTEADNTESQTAAANRAEKKPDNGSS